MTSSLAAAALVLFELTGILAGSTRHDHTSSGTSFGVTERLVEVQAAAPLERGAVVHTIRTFAGPLPSAASLSGPTPTSGAGRPVPAAGVSDSDKSEEDVSFEVVSSRPADAFRTSGNDVVVAARSLPQGTHKVTVNACHKILKICTDVWVNITVNARSCSQLKREFCFTGNKTFAIDENIDGLVLGNIGSPLLKAACSSVEVSYRLQPQLGDAPSGLSLTHDGVLSTTRQFDREATPRVDFRVECHLTRSTLGPRGKELATPTPEKNFTRSFHLLVDDVDDEPPVLNPNVPRVISVDLDQHLLDVGSSLRDMRLFPHIPVTDADRDDTNRYEVELDGGADDWLQVLQATFPDANRTGTLVTADLRVIKPPREGQFVVRFKDKSLRKPRLSKTNSVSMKFHLYHGNSTADPDHLRRAIESSGLTFSVEVPSSASNFYKLHPGFPVGLRSGVEFWMQTSSSASKMAPDFRLSDRAVGDGTDDGRILRHRLPFAVTPKTGILYVSDSELLRSSDVGRYLLKVRWSVPATATAGGGGATSDEGVAEFDVTVVTSHNDSASDFRENDRVPPPATTTTTNGSNAGGTTTTTSRRHDRVDFCGEVESEAGCEGSSGPGTPRGLCTWLSSATNVTPTCSPDPRTCPDHFCDELEAEHDTCPQDCWSWMRLGNLAGSSDDDQACTCAKPMKSCSCFRKIVKSARSEQSHQPAGKGRKKNRMRKDGMSLTDPASISSECNTACVAVIVFTAAGGIGVFVFCAFMLVIWRQKRALSKHPHPSRGGGHAFMNVVSGLYTLDDHRLLSGGGHGSTAGANGNGNRVMSMSMAAAAGGGHRRHEYGLGQGRACSGMLSGDSGTLVSTLGSRSGPVWFRQEALQIDDGWEFPRNKLSIDWENGVLGEGEFGKVIRAVARGMNQPTASHSSNNENSLFGGLAAINNNNNNSNINNNRRPMTEGERRRLAAFSAHASPSGSVVVAVKMLKSGSSDLEKSDFLSEFSLLKDVAHQNVIKLLGVCTSPGGPLLMIMEYAKYGSLRAYLRKYRRAGLESCSSGHPPGTPNDAGIAPISPRDLLCFAWQIAQGMEYLSHIKLVHRDLAARNVLLADGKVCKVSDFGLSRDVYEGEAYFKRSNGRVPVKWLAPESLLDNVYTQQSDVWSFGVLLWELATLGAQPYPGVPLERIYALLESGYRMPRPQSASVELYGVMKQCWSWNARDRPSFAELRNQLDQMLQTGTDYLDLTSAKAQILLNKLYFEDERSEGTAAAEATDQPPWYSGIGTTKEDEVKYHQLIDGKLRAGAESDTDSTAKRASTASAESDNVNNAADEVSSVVTSTTTSSGRSRSSTLMLVADAGEEDEDEDDTATAVETSSTGGDIYGSTEQQPLMVQLTNGVGDAENSGGYLVPRNHKSHQLQQAFGT